MSYEAIESVTKKSASQRKTLWDRYHEYAEQINEKMNKDGYDFDPFGAEAQEITGRTWKMGRHILKQEYRQEIIKNQDLTEKHDIKDLTRSHKTSKTDISLIVSQFIGAIGGAFLGMLPGMNGWTGGQKDSYSAASQGVFAGSQATSGIQGAVGTSRQGKIAIAQHRVERSKQITQELTNNQQHENNAERTHTENMNSNEKMRHETFQSFT